MDFRALLLALACIVNLPPACALQSPPANSSPPENPKPDTTKQDIQTRAVTMLDRARQLTDIRSPNAPPFRLTATFSFTGSDLVTVQGTYIEIWASRTQWRRDTIVGDQRRLEVAGPTRRWLLDSSDNFPVRARSLPIILESVPAYASKMTFATITETQDRDLTVQCIESKPGLHREISAFCVESESGILLQRALPEYRPRNLVEHSCSYANFKRFGVFYLPSDITCSEDTHHEIDVKITAITTALSPEASLFTPLAGAKEFPNCSTEIIPPKPISQGDVRLTTAYRGGGTVTISLIVDEKGKPRDVKVVVPLEKNLDSAAVRSVENYRFKPATCNGEPVPYPLNIQSEFTVR